MNYVFRVTIVGIAAIALFVVILPFLSGVRQDSRGRGEKLPAVAAVAQPFGLIRSVDGGAKWNAPVSAAPGVPDTILTLQFHPRLKNTLYLGTKTAGLWKSENNGETWASVEDASQTMRRDAAVYRVAFDPNDDQTMYVPAFQGGRGVLLVSRDNGSSFTKLFVVPSMGDAVFDVVADPFRRDRIVIATSQGGVLESRDHGESWRPLKWFGKSVIRLYAHPEISGVMHAVTADSRFWQSEDAGETWREVTGIRTVVRRAPQIGYGFSIFNAGAPTIRVIRDPSRASVWYATANRGLFRSDDSGATWKEIPLLVPPSTTSAFDAFAVHPDCCGWLYVVINGQLHESRDDGHSWMVRDVFEGRSLFAFWINPHNGSIFYAIAASP